MKPSVQKNIIDIEIVDSILDKIKDPDGSIDDSSFRDICVDLLEQIAQTRQKMKFKPYNRDSMTIFVNELRYSALLHKNDRRKNGELVFQSHLLGTVRNLIADQHLTGLTTLLSGLKHDDIEDLGLTADNLMRTSLYINQIESHNRPQLRTLQQKVSRIVSGTTKVKRSTRQQTKEETFKKLLEFIRDHGIRVGYVKIADRTHNIETLSGHGKDSLDLQHDIASETEDLYVRLARLFKISVSADELIRGCCFFFNPPFLKGYQTLIAEKEHDFLLPFKEKILHQFTEKSCYTPKFIRDIQFVPRTLEFTLHKLNIDRSLERLTVDDLEIDYLDPMFDVVVLVDNSRKISPLIGRIIEKFAVGRLDISATQLRFHRGTLLRIYNRSFGGRLFFRINDCVSEARSRRGLLANMDDVTPNELKERIVNILNRVSISTSKIFFIAREELLQPWIVVYSPKNMAIELPRGATPLDFAAKIHEDVLKGYQQAYICDDIWGKGKRKILPFDGLPDGVVVYIDSCLSSARGKTPDTSKIMVDPGWLLFCQAGTRARLARHLRSSEDLASELGRHFIDRCSQIFSSSSELIIDHLRKNHKQLNKVDDLAVTRAVGRGDINPVETVTKMPLFKKKDVLFVQVWLPNQPTELAQFSQMLGPHVNIEQTRFDLTPKGTIGKVVFKVKFDPQYISLYEFLKNIVKVNYYGYKVRVFT